MGSYLGSGLGEKEKEREREGRRLRVLCLHGYTQNAHAFKKRLAQLEQTCGQDVELVFIDGPIVLKPADIGGSPCDPTHHLAPIPTPTPADAQRGPRAWWLMGHDRGPQFMQFEGMEESVGLLAGVLADRQFDGVFGFSQGAAMAGIVAALGGREADFVVVKLEKPHLHPAFVKNGRPIHPPLKFCVAVAGYRPPCPLSDTLFAEPFYTPTLHVIGKNDVTVIEEWSWTLLRASARPRLEEHSGGHFVPWKATWRAFFKAWFEDPTGTIPSPGITPLSCAASPWLKPGALPLPTPPVPSSPYLTPTASPALAPTASPLLPLLAPMVSPLKSTRPLPELAPFVPGPALPPVPSLHGLLQLGSAADPHAVAIAAN
ncbi:hypothetical protein DENSPDRAFT_853697 [Dentipellis sp. KUC8613]|nr:hypothetical protein DENSPDRAFT_853697 [Dentipellis sp. KUC8613]